MEKIKEDIANNQNFIFKNHAPLLRTNSNLIENHNEEMILKPQQQDENFKNYEKPTEKLEFKENILKNKCSAVLNQLVDVHENEIIKTQMQEVAIDTSLQNELLLLHNQVNMYQEEQAKLLEEKEQLEIEFQNEKLLIKEVENEMCSNSQLISELKKYFSDLKCDYETTSNDLSCLKASEEEILNTCTQLYEEFDGKNAEMIKSHDITNVEGEIDQLTLEIENFTEKNNTLQNLYKEKEQTYLKLDEEYNQESNKRQELLNWYKTEEKRNEELKNSLQYLCEEDLIAERDKKQRENAFNLQSYKQIEEEISNKVKSLSHERKTKEEEMANILGNMTENVGLIEKMENEIRELQTKIIDLDTDISKIKDENNKIIVNLQKETEYTQHRLHEVKNSIETEKQLQETYSRDFASDQDKKQELDGKLEKHINFKDALKVTNNINMNNIAEIKKLQEQLKNKLTENYKILLILQKENLEAEIAFKKEKEQTENEIEEIEQKYRKDKEEYEKKLSIINNEIITYKQESDRVEKERQEKLQQITKQNIKELEQLKTNHADNNKKNDKIQDEINRNKSELTSLKRRKEILSIEKYCKIKKSTDALDENKQESNAGILKKSVQNSKSPHKKVTFSQPGKSVAENNINASEGQLPKQEANAASTSTPQYTMFDRLFLKLMEDYDKKKKQ